MVTRWLLHFHASHPYFRQKSAGKAIYLPFMKLCLLFKNECQNDFFCVSLAVLVHLPHSHSCEGFLRRWVFLTEHIAVFKKIRVCYYYFLKRQNRYWVSVQSVWHSQQWSGNRTWRKLGMNRVTKTESSLEGELKTCSLWESRSGGEWKRELTSCLPY